MSKDFKKDMEVDFYKLHENWRDQAGLYMEWAERWTNAVNARDKRKEFLDVDIRENYFDYGLEKTPSESAVKAKIEADSEYIELNRQVNLYASAKTAFEHRRQSLEGLTKLFIAGYFSVKDLPLQIKKAIKKQMEEHVGDAQRKGLKENPRLSKRKK